MSQETATKMTGNGDDNLQSFSFDKPFYDLSNYYGRFMSVWSSTNPLLFLVSNQKVRDWQEFLKRYKEQERTAKQKNDKLWLTKSEIAQIKKADSIVRSAVHPDTNELIPRYMRFSAYLYANIPINFGLLLSNPTTFNIALWQWINQTYYVGVNYANRNASSKFTNQDLAIAYAAAVVASIGVGLGVKGRIGKYKSFFTGSKQFFFMFTISFIANAAANVTNLFIIRAKEFKNGIPVTTEDGQEVGYSKKVGRSAVLQTALTRALICILPLGLPTISFYLLDKMGMIPKRKGLNIAQQIVVFSYSVMFAPAMSCALFPQIVKKDVNKLEPEFQSLKDKDGKPIKELYYNKGM